MRWCPQKGLLKTKSLFHPHSIKYILGVNQWNCTQSQQDLHWPKDSLQHPGSFISAILQKVLHSTFFSSCSIPISPQQSPFWKNGPDPHSPFYFFLFFFQMYLPWSLPCRAICKAAVKCSDKTQHPNKIQHSMYSRGKYAAQAK